MDALNELTQDVGLMILTQPGGGQSLASHLGVDPLVDRAEEFGVDPKAFREALGRHILRALEGDLSTR